MSIIPSGAMTNASEPLQRFWEAVRQNPHVCIAGPSGASNDNRQIRVYAYGGFLCGLPIAPTAAGTFEIELKRKITLMSKNYIDYLDQNASDYTEICEILNSTSSANKIAFGEGITFLADHFPTLIAGVEKRFSGTGKDAKQRERNTQSAVAHAHQFGESSAAIIFDLETTVPRERVDAAYQEIYHVGLTEGQSVAKPDYCVFLPDVHGHPEFRLVELKCSRAACQGSSGLEKHARDMTVCLRSEALSTWLKELLSERFSVVWQTLYADRPLPDLDGVHLTAGILFTDEDDLENRDRCVQLCKDHISNLQDFTYLYGQCPYQSCGESFPGHPVVDLARMVSWEEFQRFGNK